MRGRPLRIVVIAPLRFPIRQPHAGGLESAVWSEVDALRRRGHRVTLIAVRGSDFVQPESVFELPPLAWPDGASRTDSTYPEAYETVSVPALRRALAEVAERADDIDVISNHCLHPLPLWEAPRLGVPMVTTLHTPVDDEFVEAHQAVGEAGSMFLSVSDYTRRSWARAGVPSDLLLNGIDPAAWPAGPGGDELVWFGRIVPEKAPHLAIEVARKVGLPLTIAGRVGDRGYAEEVVEPLLGDGVRHVGALSQRLLADLVGRSAVAIATPSWAEPFGLVAPESLMCGTPVVGFSVGGVPEIAARAEGMRLVTPGDLDAMAEGVRELVALQRDDPALRRRIRRSAVRHFSLEARVSALETLFGALRAGVVAGELTA